MSQKKKLIVRVALSKKDSSKTNAMLILDLGYTQKYLSFDKSLCAECLGISAIEMYSKPLGDYLVIKEI